MLPVTLLNINTNKRIRQCFVLTKPTIRGVLTCKLLRIHDDPQAPHISTYECVDKILKVHYINFVLACPHKYKISTKYVLLSTSPFS
jgi:hypothetical protein